MSDSTGSRPVLRLNSREGREKPTVKNTVRKFQQEIEDSLSCLHRMKILKEIGTFGGHRTSCTNPTRLQFIGFNMLNKHNVIFKLE